MSNRFAITDTEFAGLKVLKRKPIGDSRGYLERLYCADDLSAFLTGKMIVQVNRTLTSKRGVVRGMHYQVPPHAEIKIVSCLRGEVFDVVVDLRNGSPTFMRWHAEILSAENLSTLLVPEGFAHGFQTLSENCELLYFHTAAYSPDSERGLNPRDEKLSIAWPMEISEMSNRDQGHPLITPNFHAISI